MIKIKDSLILSDNNEYIVVSKAEYENNTYLYLIDINNSSNIKFCLLKENTVKEVKDDKLCSKLVPLFYKATRDTIKKSN